MRVCVYAVACLLAAVSQNLVAAKDDALRTTGAVDFVVLIDESLLNSGQPKVPVENRKGERVLVPYKDVFVYLDGRNPHVVKDWAKTFRRRKPRDIEFKATDEAIVPFVALSQVGDDVPMFAGGVPLGFVTVSNSPLGAAARPGDTFRFSKTELLPVEVCDVLRRHRSAWLLVVDHDVATLTDNEGVAHFQDMPIDLEVTIRLAFPWLEKDVRLESSTLDFSKGVRVGLKIPEGPPIRHEIHILPRD
jgi:hypothetical protein